MLDLKLDQEVCGFPYCAINADIIISALPCFVVLDKGRIPKRYVTDHKIKKPSAGVAEGYVNRHGKTKICWIHKLGDYKS